MYYLDKILYIRFGFPTSNTILTVTIKIHFTFLVLLPVCDVVKSSARGAAAAAAHGRSARALLCPVHSRRRGRQPAAIGFL